MSTHDRVLIDLGPVCGEQLCSMAQIKQLLKWFPYRIEETGGEYKAVYWDEEFPKPIPDKYFPRGFYQAKAMLTDAEGQMSWFPEFRNVLYLMEGRVNWNHFYAVVWIRY